MNQKAINHEVLLPTGTSFSKRQFSPKTTTTSLTIAIAAIWKIQCWNGFVL